MLLIVFVYLYMFMQNMQRGHIVIQMIQFRSSLWCPVLFCSALVVRRSEMTEVSHQQWGEVPDRGSVDLWVLQSTQVRVEVLTLGAIIKSVCSRGKDGQMEDIVLGYNDLKGRIEHTWTAYILVQIQKFSVEMK